MTKLISIALLTFEIVSVIALGWLYIYKAQASIYYIFTIIIMIGAVENTLALYSKYTKSYTN